MSRVRPWITLGCGPSAEDLEAVDYTSLPEDDWEVSTPGEQGLDPMLLAELYHNAAEGEAGHFSRLGQGFAAKLQGGWKYEGAIDRLVGKFINSLPGE